MIVGGGATSYYLAKLLSSRNIHVTIIEKDMKRCEELVDALPDVTVDCGDGTDRQLLDEEHLENMDGFVACTGIDEVNAILSLYVMNRVKKKVVTKLNHVDLGNFWITFIWTASSIRRRLRPKRLCSMSGLPATAWSPMWKPFIAL